MRGKAYRRGIDLSVHSDAYRISGELKVTDFVMNNTFWVGVYPGMTDEMIDYMAKIIIEATQI
jgi:CDP-6-deoxy-D-xylo-4-hexulose-3-dehydrase